MNKTDFQTLLAYVSPFYDGKHILHGIEHVERMLYSAREIIKTEMLDADLSQLTYGAYFHGLATQNLSDVESFLFSHKLPAVIARIAVESLGKSTAQTLEGKILSDAHTLEGGRYLRYLKPLLTGTYMHQSLEDTLFYVEENVLGRGTVYFDYSRKNLDMINDGIARLHKGIKDELANKFQAEEWL